MAGKKGTKHSQAWKEKMKMAHKRGCFDYSKTGIKLRGRKRLDMIGENNIAKRPEVREKISKSLMGRKNPWAKNNPQTFREGNEHPQWKGGMKDNGEGYDMIYMPNHPHANGKYVYLHRLTMENHIGRFLTNDEIVHHKNGNKKDNRIENLELLTQSEHTKLHRTWKRRQIRLT